MKDTKINLCNTCEKHIPTCDSKEIEFGNGKGNDNVVECDAYKRKITLNDFCCLNCGCEVFTDLGLGVYQCCKCGCKR